MAATKIDAEKVVWLAPESVMGGAMADLLASAGTPEEVREAFAGYTPQGEYREVTGEDVVDGPQGTTVIAPKYGRLVQWVDDAPNDNEDGAGHFEIFGGDEAEYTPSRRKGS